MSSPHRARVSLNCVRWISPGPALGLCTEVMRVHELQAVYLGYGLPTW